MVCPHMQWQPGILGVFLSTIGISQSPYSIRNCSGNIQVLITASYAFQHYIRVIAPHIGIILCLLGFVLSTNTALPAYQESQMAETKTKPTGANVDAYLLSRASHEQLADCKTIMAICKRVTGQAPKMWGPSIVGYGSYTYRYESGHSGEACLTGFAVRGKELVIYLSAQSPEQVALLAKLGKHKMTKSCLYFKRLADLDIKVLEALVAGSVAELRRRYP